MIQVVFNDAGSTDAEKKLQISIANLIKKKLDAHLTCECKQAHAVIQVGGNWRAGDFEITEVTACCLRCLANANDVLNGSNQLVPRPTLGSGLVRQTAFGLS